MRSSFAALLLLLLACHSAATEPRRIERQLQTGDLVFQTSRSRQSAAIQQATHSPLSHVGLVEVVPDGVFVIEAVGPVKRTRFSQWQARGRDSRILVLRPEGLSAGQRSAAIDAARRHLGKPYDWRFAPGDEALYCSELVREAYRTGAGVTFGQLERLGSLDLRRLGPALSKRYGGRVPHELEVITPASLAADSRLHVVHSDFDAPDGAAAADRRVSGRD